MFGKALCAPIHNLKTDITLSELKAKDYKITKVLPENRHTQWVVHIPNGVVLNEGGILTEDGYILKDTELIENAHGLKNKKRDLNQENPMYFKGKLAVIASSGSENWYHWLLQTLPRLVVLARSNLAYDRIYVNNMNHKWQVESLKLVLKHLKISEEKLLVINGNCVLQADSLVVPSIPFMPSKRPHLPLWMRSILNTIFLPKPQHRTENYKKIYISRSKASIRRITNEKELIEVLKKQGFKILHLENLSPHEQARIFSQARIIVGPHGSGFANLIFTTPGYTLIEIDHKSDPLRSYYKRFTHLTSGHYHPFYVDHVSEDRLEDDIYVDIPSFLNFLKALKTVELA